MNVTRDTLEDQLQNHEAKLRELRAFVSELKATAARHGTEGEHFEGELFEAEHNVEFYEAEAARLRAEIGKHGDRPAAPRGGPVGGGAPRVSKQSVGALVVALAAGALVALGLKARRGGKGSRDNE
jgi:hypothetical protein